ncbi:MAG: site-2 protease family protein [Candidatus Jordarchaeales archaeon]
MIEEWQFVALILLIFWSGVMAAGKLLKLEKYGFTVLPFAVVWRTTRLNNIMSRIALRAPRLWRALGDASIPLSYSALGYGVYLLFLNLVNAFFQPQHSYPIVPLIPGITITWFSFLYAAVGIIVTLVLHELAHGLTAKAEGIPIKSSGLLFVLFMPGGFIEVDEEAMEKARTRSRVRVLSSGSAVNLATALIALLVLANFQAVISPWYGPSLGVIVTGVDSHSFAYGKLFPSTILFAINGTPIPSPAALDLYLLNVKPFDTLKLTTSMGEITVTAGINPRAPYKGYIGIMYPQPFYLPYPSSWWLGYTFPNHVYMVIQWIFIVSFSVSIINMMPVPALDGDKILKEAVSLVVSERKGLCFFGRKVSMRKFAINAARAATICLLVLNALIPLMKTGFIPL